MTPMSKHLWYEVLRSGKAASTQIMEAINGDQAALNIKQRGFGQCGPLTTPCRNSEPKHCRARDWFRFRPFGMFCLSGT
jgi:hypothetical protein